MNSPSTQPVEESKASFSFSLNGPAFIENSFYAHIIQEGDILAFDGSDDPDSEYFINQTSGQFALPIKITKSGVVDSVNFGIEFR
ncbi:MAG: hypothetical protein MJ200_02420 [Mycoplasmoidaceae bacterium]|nr:hypothetical protein [Mycoplasmoidaceae bacterium]